MANASVVTRRDFLKVGTAAGGVALVIGFYLPGKFEALAAAPPAEPVALNAWVRIAPDNSVTLFIDKTEMGQGVVTSLAMLLAEELELDWKNVKFEFAPAAPPYFNPLFGLQGTGGSTSIRASWGPLTKAGAAAREMLVAAAAQQWYVEPSACHVENGAVVHNATNKRLGYGALVEQAAKLPVPANPALKDPKDYKYIGKPVKRLDTPSKVNGKAGFGIDVRLPNIQHAVVARCPVFGGKLKTFDDSKAKAARGVNQALQISTGVAVVEICRTCFTPRTAFAFESSKVLSLPPKTGQRATTACWIFGRRTSMPKPALPFTFEGVSSRFTGLPMYL